jgi:4-diphosphocytidyl-2-C-methyl-D-erythritol kinase
MVDEPPAQYGTVAPAKINWTLEVLGRRDDGYHEIRSVIQTISLTDRLELHPAPAYSLTIDGPEAAVLDPWDNLVTKAARALGGRPAGNAAAIRLEKHIPASAGLGGGSSDAAAALRLLRRLWRVDGEAVGAAAAALGSDVPFFLDGGLQAARGRGELLTPIPMSETVTLIVATPPIAIAGKTARLYAQLRPSHFTSGAATDALVQKLMAGGIPAAADYVNVFDRVSDAVFPGLSGYRRIFERVTGTVPLLAGAGPSLFAVCPLSHAGDRDALRRALAGHGFKAWIVSTTPSLPASSYGGV